MNAASRRKPPRLAARARVGLLGGALVLVACVGQESGVREARAIVDGRLHLPHVEDEDVSRVVGDLLSKPLTAESVVRIAVLKSPNVHAAFDRIGIARGALVSALQVPNPTVEASLRFVSGSEPDIDVGGAIDLREFVLMPLRNAVASDGLDAASIEAASIAIGVGLRARFAYIDYVAAIQSLALERQVVQALDAAAELSKQITDAGNDHVLLALGDRALLEEGRLRVESAEMRAALMRGELTEAMGLGPDDAIGWETSDRLAHPPASDEMDVDAAVKTAVEVNLDLVAARARVDSLDNAAILGRLGGVLPALEVGVVAERHDDHWGVGPSISVGVPLFNTGQGDVDRAEAGAKEQKSLAKKLEIAIRVRVAGLTKTIAGARRQAERYRTTVLPLRQEIIERTQLLYNGMGTSAFALLDAKREAIIAGQGYVEALRTYWRARTELELLLAGHLRESM